MQTAFLANEETHFDGNFVPFQRHISYPALAPDPGPKVEVNPYHQVRIHFLPLDIVSWLHLRWALKFLYIMVRLPTGSFPQTFTYFASKYHTWARCLVPYSKKIIYV